MVFLALTCPETFDAIINILQFLHSGFSINLLLFAFDDDDDDEKEEDDLPVGLFFQHNCKSLLY